MHSNISPKGDFYYTLIWPLGYGVQSHTVSNLGQIMNYLADFVNSTLLVTANSKYNGEHLTGFQKYGYQKLIYGCETAL
jgi:hypothetical protein